MTAGRPGQPVRRLGIVVLLLALTGCSSTATSTAPTSPEITTRGATSSAPSSPASDPSASPSPTPSRRASRPSQQEVDAAVTTLRAYLHAWATEGPSRASRYLVTSQRAPSDEGAPRISKGVVTSCRLYGWKGPAEFTLYATLSLTFVNNPMAWNRGTNGRFVTAHRVGHGYLLEFATSP